MDYEDKVIQAQKGNDHAFYELIQERKVELYRTAFIYVKNEQDALDIVSDTVYKAYTGIRKLKEPKFFGTWLTRILINCSIDFLRKQKPALPFDEMTEVSQSKIYDHQEVRIDLYTAIDQLNERSRSIIILKYFQDMTLTQIAEVLECPLGTVKTYLHKALKELRLDLKEDDFHESRHSKVQTGY